MNTNEKYTLANLVMDHALKSGAEQVSVSIDDSRRSNIEIRDQKIDKLTESVRNSLTIELFCRKEIFCSQHKQAEKEELFRFVEEAIAATRFLAEDEFRSLPEQDLYYKGGADDLRVVDPKIDTIDPKMKIDLANQVLDEAFKKDERIISVTSTYSDRISNRVFVTSNGFKGDTSNSNVSLSAEVSVKGETSRPSDYWYENAIFFDKLVKSSIGTKALEKGYKETRSKRR
ncbi:MAG: hypothetical protein IPJ37_09195 [Bacteroidales bacterium]|nr:hypothetical protein [Bacteroidales bacterium]